MSGPRVEDVEEALRRFGQPTVGRIVVFGGEEDVAHFDALTAAAREWADDMRAECRPAPESRGTDMSTKLDLQVRYECDGCGWHDEGIGGKHSRPATITELVAALMAKGGETIWWCEEHDFGQGHQYDPDICPGGYHGEPCRMVKRLVFPLPVESAEAKETP